MVEVFHYPNIQILVFIPALVHGSIQVLFIICGFCCVYTVNCVASVKLHVHCIAAGYESGWRWRWLQEQQALLHLCRRTCSIHCTLQIEARPATQKETFI